MSVSPGSSAGRDAEEMHGLAAQELSHWGPDDGSTVSWPTFQMIRFFLFVWVSRQMMAKTFKRVNKKALRTLNTVFSQSLSAVAPMFLHSCRTVLGFLWKCPFNWLFILSKLLLKIFSPVNVLTEQMCSAVPKLTCPVTKLTRRKQNSTTKCFSFQGLSFFV